MSISDPLIKELKASFQPLLNLKEIKDDSPDLVSFCKSLERIFNSGLINRGDGVPTPWLWMNAVAFEMEKGTVERIFAYVRSIDETRNCKKVTTEVGKFRQLIRCCLKYKCLHVTVDVMVRQIGERRLNWYRTSAVIGHEVLGEIFLSVLLQASHLSFTLDTSNSRFLDFSWILPETVAITFVPCQTLGLVVTFHNEMAIIVKVEPGSVADEDKKVEPGDIIDEINDSIMTSESQGKLKNILSKSRTQPINLRLVKMHCQLQGKAYLPGLMIFKKSTRLAHLCGKIEQTNRTVKQQLTYLGCCSVGRRGDVTVIENGIKSVTDNQSSAVCHVSIDCRELDVVVYAGEEKLMRYPYVRIASCGHSIHKSNCFAFVVGDGPCCSAVDYTCHVFEASSSEVCASVLLALKLGFERTQCAA